MHSSERTGGAWGVYLTRDWRSTRYLRLGLGLSGGGADEGFLALNMMLEVLALPRFVLTPVVAVGGGVLTEPEWGGAFQQATAGVELRVLPRLRVRAAHQWGLHDGQSGPTLKTLGAAFLLGARQWAR